jgi:hypothetical protein
VIYEIAIRPNAPALVRANGGAWWEMNANSAEYPAYLAWLKNGGTPVFVNPPDPIPEKVTETQFMRAAVKVGIVTADEAKAYLARGVIPAFVETAVAQIPANVRTDAELKIIGSDTFHRTDPVFAMLIAGGAATSEQVDDLFRLAATLD